MRVRSASPSANAELVTDGLPGTSASAGVVSIAVAGLVLSHIHLVPLKAVKFGKKRIITLLQPNFQQPHNQDAFEMSERLMRRLIGEPERSASQITHENHQRPPPLKSSCGHSA
jgi:hypothetical protein